MSLSLRKLSAGEAMLLLAALLHSLAAVRAASLRHHRLREPAAYTSPSSDMIKALEYIESLKRRTDGAPAAETPTGDYDEVDKFRLLVQLASMRDEDAARWPDSGAPQWVRAALRALEQQAEGEGATVGGAVGGERRTHKSRRPSAAGDDAEGPVTQYGGVVRPHKKYPLMFEDEENGREVKRATEDLDEQYTAQSLANMRSLLEELGRLQRKRDGEDAEDQDAEDQDGMYRLRDVAYEDVAGGGEEWVPLEEQVETEELVKGSRQEMERGLADSDEESETIGEPQRRRASDRVEEDGGDDDDDNADDTKLVDYYLLKVLEMTDQARKRDLQAETQGLRRRPLSSSLSLNSRPSLLDPHAIKQLLSAMSMKLQVPPEDLVGLLFMEETRKQQQRLPEPQMQLARKPTLLQQHQQQQQQQQPRYRSRVIKYYSGRQPEVTVSEGPVDIKTEELLKALGLGNTASKSARYFTKPRPYKTALSRYFAPSNGRRGSLFTTSDLNRGLSKRKDDYDDAVDEDEVATFLAAKLMTEYPDDEPHKRALDSRFPYEAYEEAMKDYFEQVDTGKSAPTKRDTQGKEMMEEEEEGEEEEAPQKPPTENSVAEQSDQQLQEPVSEGEKEHRGKLVAGM
ncbi:secretogranin-2b [Astyanax mexicanus]|uniref:secretogranin-2b n=1 Tax=Astyanax mexicanus TaxID=7994 RepID=UPI0020CB1E3A|nr:secretogranin-2b [Astyanax mexicanus]XP_049334927.1 secretogranin-2b [Astyanax mexicanus]